MIRAAALGNQVWIEARATNDFAKFLPALERNLDLKRRYVECFEWEDSPYTPLLDDFEPYMLTSEVAEVFGTIRPVLAELVQDALERVELSPPGLFLDRYPHELSGGQRQRVAIAAAIVLGPELLVADEPVSMLDVSVRAGVLALLDRLRRDGLGVLMITHDLSTAAHFADRIAVMYLGRIVEEGPAASVVSDPQHPYTKALLSVVPRRDPRERTRPQILRGEAPDAVRIPAGCRFHPRCPIAIDDCRRIDPALEPAGGSDHMAACILAG